MECSTFAVVSVVIMLLSVVQLQRQDHSQPALLDARTVQLETRGHPSMYRVPKIIHVSNGLKRHFFNI